MNDSKTVKCSKGEVSSVQFRRVETSTTSFRNVTRRDSTDEVVEQ